MRRRYWLLITLGLASCGCPAEIEEIKFQRTHIEYLEGRNAALEERNRTLEDSLRSTLLLLEQPSGPGMNLDE